MKIAWMALALIIACGAWGQAQPPIPTEQSSPPQKTTRDKGSAAYKDPRGTEDRPLFVSISGVPVVKMQGGPQAEQVPAQSANKEAISPPLYLGFPADFWTAAFTLLLGLVGVATAVVFISQTKLLSKQVGEMVKATAATEKAAKAADSAAQETARQAEDLRQARILLHRPRLHVRNIVMHQPWFHRGFPIRGQFYVSNIGGVRAHVADSHCEVLWNVNGLPMERPYEGKDGNQPMPDKPIIAAGSNATGIFTSDSNFRFDIVPAGNDPAHHKLYILGWIEYLDDLAIRRRTAFCREFIQRDGAARFYPVTDPDYEYEE